MAECGGKWVRPALITEVIMEAFHQKGSMVTCYSLTLNAAQSLQKAHLEEAMRHLYRKVPTLRLCMQNRQSVLWFREMKEERIELKMLEKADFRKEFEDMTIHKYNSTEGPMWCVYLLPDTDNVEYPIPGVKEEFPHQYRLLFGMHHAITDGTSTMAICGLLVSLLNDVISGRPIDDTEQLGELNDGSQTSEIRSAIMEDMKSNPEMLKKMSDQYFVSHLKDIAFMKLFPAPCSERRTSNIDYDLDETTTSMFLEKCREKEVSFQTGFCAVINAALADMMLKAGLKKDVYDLPHFQIIDVRKYWRKSSVLQLGVHVGALYSNVATPSHVSDHFWSYAKMYHDQFTLALKSKSPFVTSYLRELCVSDTDLSLESYMKNIPPVTRYYGITNMGNIDTYFPSNEEEDQVKATHLMRMTSIHNVNSLCCHVVQIFKGRLLYGLNFVTYYMNVETAQQLVDQVFSILRNVTDKN